MKKLSPEELELNNWKKKLVIAWTFTIPLVILMIITRFLDIMFFDEKFMVIISLLLAFPVVFIAGFSTIKSGIKGFTSLYFNMDSLIMLGTLIAYFTGFFSLFIVIQDYSGISSMIMAFFITGKYIETKAKGKASKEIKKLLELGAKTARILKDNKEIEVKIEEVNLGDILMVKPGEKIPTDGIIIKGESSIDESMVTGESIPKDKKKNDIVIGATINQDGILYIKATKIGKDTFLAHIIDLIEETQSTKVPIQRLADKITNIFVPSILILSILTVITWYIISKDISKSIQIAVAVLVIACPCSLGLATPTALMVGSGIGAKKGILIRKGEAIQTIKQIKTIVFDKTGTITKGIPEVKEIYVLPKIKKDNFMLVAASLENLSEHPLSKAIVSYSNIKKFMPVKQFKISRGKGLSGIINKKKIKIGNQLLMKENNIIIKEFVHKINEFEEKGLTTIIIAEEKKVLGIIGISDDIKEDSIHAIRLLKRKGYKIVLITGDNERTAKAISEKVGINNYLSNVLPEDKANKVKLIQKHGFVAFVGDGINDAPALKQANVGIAIGSGSDIAIESGDIVLAKGSIIGVYQAINLSKETFKKIKQNLFWAFAYNVTMIPLAVLGLIHPVLAEIAMAASSITVVTNANLLRLKKI
jgi:Cu+-exporting ATPase